MKYHRVYGVPLWSIPLVLISNVTISCFITQVDVEESIFTQRKSLLVYGINTENGTSAEEIKNRILLFSCGVGLFAIIPHYFSKGTVFSGTLWNPLVCSCVIQVVAIMNILYGGDGTKEVFATSSECIMRTVLTLLKGCTIYDFYHTFYNTSELESTVCNCIQGIYEEQDDIYEYYCSQVWIIQDICRFVDVILKKRDKLTFAMVINEVDNTTWWKTHNVWHGNHTIWESNRTGYKKIHMSATKS